MKTLATNNPLLKWSLCVLILILSVLPSVAQQLTPECYVEVFPKKYVVHFELPNYWFEENDLSNVNGSFNVGADDECGAFIDIKMPTNYDVTDIVGYPELPFFSLDLLLPNNVTFTQTSSKDFVLENKYINRYITPAIQGGTAVIIDSQYIYTRNDIDPCMRNSQYYNYGYDSIYPNGFYQDYYSFSSITSYQGSKGITLSIFPFSYHPERGWISVLKKGTFEIEFNGQEITSTIQNYLSSTKYSDLPVLSLYDNFNLRQFNISDYNNPEYLIIAVHQDMQSTLETFVRYKTRQNYNVKVIYLDSFGSNNYFTTQNIQNLINNSGSNKPDFVLLVGSLNEIPASEGKLAPDDPYSDDRYHPFIGRWIVNGENGNYPQLANIISKTIVTENWFADSTFTSSAALFIGKNPNSKRESKDYVKSMEDIYNEISNKMNIPSTVFNGCSQNVTFNSMAQALYAHPSIMIYRGNGVLHTNSNGTYHSCSIIDNPYYVCPSNVSSSPINNVSCNPISSLGNFCPFPMTFGFASSLFSYATNNNFASQWIAESNGGVTFYGATTETKLKSDRYLAEKVFKIFNKLQGKLDNFPIGLWLNLAEEKYLRALVVPARRHQIKRYNLAGDPSFYVFGMENNGAIAPFHAPQEERVEESEEDEIVAVKVFNIYGQLLETHKSIDFQLEKSNTVYIIQVEYANGSTKTYKIL